MKKYELTSETKVINGVELHRIKALKSFRSIEKGDLGGWIESEKNLSQDGDAWVSGNAVVRGDATVCGGATVCEYASVSGYAFISENATIRGNARIFVDARVGGHATVGGYAFISGKATVEDKAKVHGKTTVRGKAWVGGNATISGNAIVSGNATISGNATVSGYAVVCGNAKVRGKEDFIVFKNWWSSGRYFTWTRSNNKWNVGCFYGSGEELIAKAYKDSEKSGREYERVVKYVESILKEENNNK